MNRLTLMLGIATAVLMVAVAFLLGRQSTAVATAPAPAATATMALSASSVGASQVAPAANPMDWAGNPEGWSENDDTYVDIVGTCSVTVQGHAVMQKECTGTVNQYHATIFEDPADCTFNLVTADGVTTATVSTFRDRCMLDKARKIPLPEISVPLGVVRYESGCWINEQVRVCFRKAEAA